MLTALTQALMLFVSLALASNSIPYDNTLVVGNFIPTQRIESLKELAKLQQKVNGDEEAYNNVFQNKLQLEMSIREFKALGVSIPESITEALENQNEALKNALVQLTNSRISYAGQYNTQMQNKDQTLIGSMPASPIDLGKSKLANFDFSSDSMKMTVQSFFFSINDQESQSKIKAAAESIAGTFDGFGSHSKTDATHVSEDTLNKALQAEKNIDVVVVTIVSTHKSTQTFSPMSLNVDRMIRAYKALVEGKEEWEPNEECDSKPAIHLLTGRTFGSAFVGFIFYKSTVDTSQEETSVTKQNQATASFKQKIYFRASAGGSSTLSNEAVDAVSKLTEKKKVQSFINIYVQGIISSVKSNEVQMGIRTMDLTAAANNAVTQFNQVAGDADTLKTETDAAAQKNQFVDAMNSQTSNLMTTLNEIQDRKNRVYDANALMTAIDDYVERANNAVNGVPLNFMVDSYSECDIRDLYLDKYDNFQTTPSIET